MPEAGDDVRLGLEALLHVVGRERALGPLPDSTVHATEDVTITGHHRFKVSALEEVSFNLNFSGSGFPLPPSRTSWSMNARNAASVLPEPVGAAISVSRRRRYSRRSIARWPGRWPPSKYRAAGPASAGKRQRTVSLPRIRSTSEGSVSVR